MYSGTGFDVFLSPPAEARFEIFAHNALDAKQVGKDLDRYPCIDCFGIGNYTVNVEY